jgi:hypothetical protein
LFLLVLPIVGLFTGYYREMGAVAVFQAVMYVFAFLGLRALAWKREAKEDQANQAQEPLVPAGILPGSPKTRE